MANKDSKYKYKFEYCMNALHYCIYKGEVWLNYKVERQIYRLIKVLSIILGLKKYYERRVKKFHDDKKNQDYLYGKKIELSVGEANSTFGFLYSGYPGLLSFILLGIANGICENVKEIVVIILLGLPIGLGYIPAYKAVFSNDKYLKYHKKFKKKDEQWHKKWKWITIVFCIISLFFTTIGGVCAMGGIQEIIQIIRHSY
ncbi:hypothetical protein [Segatella baroniae]|jgi:hypothetical protein|uniref:hypothetical protein n=1 Tax=Segatella baroniae TaxID=305719 RepID=UPI00041F87B2|nr:hypothetical protein [Segatella baroniae]